MTELKAFVDMLARAGIGHGTRTDHRPPGTAVQVEHGDDDDTVTDWVFDDQGRLMEVYVCTDGE